MVLILYGSDTCPPVCAVRMVCAALGVQYDFKVTSGAAGDTRKPEFLKVSNPAVNNHEAFRAEETMNPQHSIPTINDDGFVLWDSHAISTYLADKMGASAWYPTDLKQRAVVDQRLHFDNAMLFTRSRDLVEPLFYANSHELSDEKVRRVEEAIEVLGELIQDGGWIAGAKPTIADCCAAANTFFILALLPTFKPPVKVAAWMKRCEETLPAFDSVARPGLCKLAEIVADKTRKK